jgi:hypothetical protein
LDFVCIEAVLKHRGHQKIVDKLPEEKK